MPSTAGIEICVNDVITIAGAQASWCRLTCATTTDEVGVALTYLPSGTCLYTGPLSAFGTISVCSTSGASSVFCSTASTFQVGDYIKIGSGTANQEIVKVIGYTAPNRFTVTQTTYPHYVGETIYACGRKFWMRVEVPLNYVGGVATNFYDIALRRKYVRTSRF